MGGETEVTREGKGLRAWPVEWLPAVSWQVEAEPADHRGGPGTPPAIGEGIAGFTLRGPRPEAQGEPEGRQGTPGLLGWRDLAGTWTTSPPGGHLLFGKR